MSHSLFRWHFKASSSLFLLPFFALTLFVAEFSEAATITIVNLDGAGEGFNDPTPAAPVGGNAGTTIGQQRLNVFQRVAEIWGSKISSSVPIRVGASFDPLSCTPTSAVLGSAGAVTVIRDFTGAPVANTWYPTALANALAGADLDPTEDDIRAQFNSNIGSAGCLTSLTWYYGLDGNPAAGTIELLDTVLHEVAHGLGFQTFVDLSSGAKLLGFDDTFMRNLENHGTGESYPTMTDAERVSASTASGNLHWIGANVVANSGFLTSGKGADNHVEMYAPNPREPGSSVSHFSTSLSPDELMEPFLTATSDRRLTSFVMQDIGWTVTPEAALIQSAGSAISSENCVAPNGSIDPGETVTLDFSLLNSGVTDTVNLVATLQAISGVTSPSGAQSYGALIAGGASVSRPFTFTASGTCGGTVTAILQLQDGAINLGTVTNTFLLGSAPPTTNSFSNTGTITIPNSGSGTPYPSAISVAGLIGTISKVSVTLTNITHTRPDDLDVLLVSPAGQKVLLMSDAGASGDLGNVSLTFDDSASLLLPDGSQIVSGTFKPSNYDTTTDGFAAPAPGSPYAATLSAFNASNPNGTWALYVRDDSPGSSGSIANGWRLTIVTVPPAVCCVPATVTGRKVFYNRSAWDGNDPAANANDDNAVATNKTALLPDGTATFTNYTSYSRGLNGIMVDIANLPGTPTVGDFVFKTGNNNTPAGWSTAPDPVSVTVRAGAGTGGSDRVTLIWNDNNLDGVVDANEAVAKQWLEVTVKANANTGLATDDVFYFGNAVGEGNVDNPGTRFRVTAADALQAINNLIGLGTASLANVNDHDRDQKVKSADALLALNNLSALSALWKLDLSSGGGSLLAVSTTAPAPSGPFLGMSRLSPGTLRLWLWEPQQSNPSLLMTEDLASGKWRPIPSDWLKPLGGGLFEVNVPIGAGSAFLRLESNGTGALDR